MRLQKYGLILLAVYLVFINGYDSTFPALRWFNHIFITVLSLGWLGWRIKNRRGLPPSPLNTMMLAIIALGFLSVIFSYDPRMALENMWQILIYALAFLFIVNSFHRAQNRLIIEIVFLIAALIVLLSAIQVGSVFFGWGFTTPPEQAWIHVLGANVPFPIQTDLRISLPLGVSTQVAAFVAPLIMICLTWAMSATLKSYKFIATGFTILLSIVLILTFSRGGLVALTTGLILFFTLRLIQIKKPVALFSRLNLMITVGIIGLIIIVGSVILTISSQSGRRSGDSVRLDLWRSAVEMTIDNPITGVGTGLYGRGLREYRQLVTARDRLSTADNLYLTVVAENGIGAILVLLFVIMTTGQSWWKLRQEAQANSAYWIRLNGMMATLIAMATHNIFDTVISPARFLLFSVVIIYCIVKPAKSRLEAHPQGNQFLAVIGFIIILAYGIWFVVIIDPAHRKFEESLSPQNDQLALAQEALAIDPYLNLYQLQITYLIGQDALDNPTSENLDNAIQEYESALILEPTWDTGMINLAALYEANGNLDQAQYWLDTARNILPINTASLHWARIAELNNYTDEEEEIVLAYLQSIRVMAYLPLSDFWTETPLRQEALDRYLISVSLEQQYRVTRVHFPEQLEALVPENPETASEWWVVGEHALTLNNTEEAITAFSNAINLAPIGNYYASRARAYALIDEIDLANTDLQIADFLSASDEYTNIIRASIATDPDEIKNFRLSAIPQMPYSQNFEGVLFNKRTANFITYRPMRFIGRGASVMQVWIDLAEQYEVEGNISNAIVVYNAIAFQTPENNDALEEVARIQE